MRMSGNFVGCVVQFAKDINQYCPHNYNNSPHLSYAVRHRFNYKEGIIPSQSEKLVTCECHRIHKRQS